MRQSPLSRLAPAALAAAVVASLLTATSPGSAAALPGSREALERFASPGREHASAPLWVWNDRLTEEQVRSTLRDLAAQKVLQVFVHPRPGLMTPYLSDEWFRLWKAALDEARRLDMNVWIYDENSYPSGFAGGLVMDRMPEARGLGLVLSDAEEAPRWGDTTVGVYRITDEGALENLTGDAKAGGALPAGRYVVARTVRAADSPWHGKGSYVDLLRPGVTEAFLDITLGAYRREVGEEFGKRIPGVFADEPHIRPAAGLPWTPDLPEVFRERWGYDLLDHLPSLARPVGDWKHVRHNYYRVLLDLFVERWARPYYEACDKEGLEFTGHYWEHEWPRCILVPDNMALAAWQHRPGIDTLMNRYDDESPHAQFGNVRAVREIASVANQLDRPRALCEAYGAAGWDLRFEDMKRIADWLLVLGVNTIDEHLSYITLRGARKKDHPQSFSYHEPWWEAYHHRASYTARLSAALSTGKQVQSFLILEPTTTAWLYQADPSHRERLEALGRSFQKLVLDLELAQVECDLGSEDLIARHGSYRVRRLKVGKRAYRAVVIPPMTETLDSRTVELLEELTLGGGAVIVCGDPPPLVDGKPTGAAPGALPYGWQRATVEELPGLLASLMADGFSIRREEGDRGLLFHHRRKLSDGELVFLVNSSDEAPARGVLASPARGVEEWDPLTGQASPAAFRTMGSGVEVPFDLPPCGSRLVLLSWQANEPAPARSLVVEAIPPAGETRVERLDPNVLPLDFVDVTAGGETLEGAHVYRAAQFAFRKNGMDRNPWDSAVQFRDELIRKTFPPDSGVKALYRFRIEDAVPAELFVAIERPDLYTVRLNGTRLVPRAGSWWLDRSFGKIDARAAARVGENRLEIEASPFTIEHEIEAAYVLGDFGVRPADRGFAIAAASDLATGAWAGHGLPLYGGRVAYRETFELPELAGRYRVRLPAWNGSVAEVLVGGRSAGIIEAPPYTCDVTDLLEAGSSEVEVRVIGTLRNTLGPHHAGAVRGSAWPSMFHRAPESGPPPGRDYSTLEYGLFERPRLEQLRERS